MVRTALYEAANAVLSRPIRFSALKRWAMDLAKRRGLKRAKVALARKLGIVLHRSGWMARSSVGPRRCKSPPDRGGLRVRAGLRSVPARMTSRRRDVGGSEAVCSAVAA
jgi:hypothetical protein